MAEVTKTTKKETKTVTVEVEVPTVTIQLPIDEAKELHKVLGRQGFLFDLYVKLGDVLNGGFNT